MAVSGCKEGLIRVQPSYSDRDNWMKLARGEKLGFEPLELFTGQKPTADKLDWYRSCGLVRGLHGAFIDVNPASGDMDYRALSQKRCEESCRMAQLLGVSQVVLHCSCFPFLRGGYLDFWAGTCAEFYEQLAQTYDLLICIENSMDVDPTPLSELMRRIEHPGVKVCLDVGHAHYSRCSLDGWFDALGEHVAYMHLSDNRGLFDDHLPLGEGTADWALADQYWRALGGNIPVTLEVGSIENVKRSLAYLRSNGFFGTGE